MDKPTVPTVFNQSIFYAAFEVSRRVTNYLQSQSSKNKKEPPEQANTNDDEDPTPELDSSQSKWKATTAQDIVYPYAKKPVLKDINLVLKPGTTYLVLGPPGCGKTVGPYVFCVENM